MSLSVPRRHGRRGDDEARLGQLVADTAVPQRGFSRAAHERILVDDPYVQEDVFGTRSLREWRPFIASSLDAG